MSSIWADTNIKDLVERMPAVEARISALEARLTELVAQNAALAAKLVPVETPAPAPPPRQVTGRRG